MEIRALKTEDDYKWGLGQIEEMFDAEPGTPEADRLEVLVTLVEAYEDAHYPIPLPDPIEAIKFRMEAQDLSRKDLEAYIGSRARVSEVLNKKRHLTLEMIRNLERGLGIPSSVLIQQYDLVPWVRGASLSATPGRLETVRFDSNVTDVVILPLVEGSLQATSIAALHMSGSMYQTGMFFAGSGVRTQAPDIDILISDATPAPGSLVARILTDDLAGKGTYLELFSLVNTETRSAGKEIAQ